MTQFPKRFADKLPVNVYTCADCGRDLFDDGDFCAHCASILPYLRGSICPACGRRTVANGLCLDCKKEAPAFTLCRAPFDYYGQVRRLIYKMKFRNRPYLAQIFAPFMVETYKEHGFSADAVAFIPMTEKAVKKRGYNQAALLAKCVAEELNLPLLESALSKVKTTRKQRRLNKEQRKENLKGCFKPAPKAELNGKNILLIDDIVTTGATLSEGAAALKRKGVNKVFCMAVASTPAPSLIPGLKKAKVGYKPAPVLTPALTKCTMRDFSTVKKLIRGAKKHLKQQGINQWQDGFPNSAALKEDILLGRARILSYGGYSMGYCCLEFNGEKDYETLLSGAWQFPTPYAAMHRVALSKKTRGTGASLTLFTLASEECKKAGFQSLRIDTHPDNKKMQRALSSAGFTNIGKVVIRDTEMLAFEKDLTQS